MRKQRNEDGLSDQGLFWQGDVQTSDDLAIRDAIAKPGKILYTCSLYLASAVHYSNPGGHHPHVV